MCTPLAVASLALTAAGTGASMAGAHKADKAQQEAQGAEILRQQKYRDESQKYFNQSLGQSSEPAATQTINDAAAKNAAALNSVVGPQNVQAPTASAEPKVINTELGNRLSQANTFNRQQGTAEGRLQGYGDWNLSNALNNAEASRQIGLRGNLMQGSAQVLPYEMQAAAHKGDNLRTLGTVLSSLGSVAGLGASMGVGAPAVAAPAVTDAATVATTATGLGGSPALNAIGQGLPISGYLLNAPTQFQRRGWGY